jgi:hypothetical protein
MSLSPSATVNEYAPAAMGLQTPPASCKRVQVLAGDREMTELKCWNCGVLLTEVPTPISRQANCPACFNELHCCRLCSHFDPAIAADQCAEDRADPPVIKDGANFCEWFDPNPQAFRADSSEKDDEARARLDAMFEKQPPTTATENSKSEPLSKQDEAKAELNRLFSGKNSSPEADQDGT